MPDYDKKWISGILSQNKEKNFIQRVMEPDKWPRINNKDGSYSTHKMSWSTIGGKNNGIHIVYPNIIYDEESKGLKELKGKDAVDHAISTGEYITFDKTEEADWFGKNYKMIWEK
jgi:hypothetical protein